VSKHIQRYRIHAISRIKTSIYQQIWIAFIEHTFVSRLHAWLPDRPFLAPR
jgi:hypothetical protein